MTEPLVRAEGLRWSADPGTGAREILAGIDLTLREGERVGLVGRSGAGKTTLVTLLAGLLEPTAGRVTGVDGEALRPGDVGLVFQEAERGFFEETVLEDVSFGPRNRGLDAGSARERAREALATVGLDPDEMAGRAPETLSGGEARRAAIAGVVAMRPRVLIFDEPTTGLDADGLQRFRAVLSALRERGQTYVIVSHDLGLVTEECDRVLVLEGAAIRWDGSARRLPEGLPEEWRADPGAWGGEVAVVAQAMRERGWIDDDTPLEPEALAAAWGGARPPEGAG